MRTSGPKDVPLHGDVRLQLRLECCNVLNHAKWNPPIVALADHDLGRIRGKRGDGRRMQLVLRLRF